MRLTKALTRLAAGFLLFGAAFPQDAQDATSTIRITVNLVQVDAVVTDSKGKQVTDLKASDFELLQDGKAQKISHFSYISIANPKAPTPSAVPAIPPAGGKKLPPPPGMATRLRQDQIRRTIALVIDDLGLSFESTAQVRMALKRFVDTQMEPGDLVAIIRTGAGMGALQSFTSNKAELYAAIERVKFNMIGRVGVSSFAAIGEADETGDAGMRAQEFRNSAFTVGTLGAIRYIANGLKDLPGRKSVIIFSEHMQLFNSQGMDQMVLDNLRNLTDLCNRAAVVLYTIDPRGLPTLSLTAADRPSMEQLNEAGQKRSTEYWNSQEGLNYLAKETGGMFIHDTNDISRGLGEVLADQQGYYLLGYSPDSGTFDQKTGKKFHSVKVRLKRPGLQVRTRNGFFGVPDQAKEAEPQTREAQMNRALTSPFGANGIRLRLTGVFSHNAKTGSFITSTMHINGEDLKWVEDPLHKNDKGEIVKDYHKTEFDIVTITFGDNGTEVDRSNMHYTLGAPGEGYKSAIANGLVYTLPHPVKKPGAYQLRTALRDSATGKVGSANQFIEVPDVSKGRLTLSGMVMRAGPGKTATAEAGPDKGDPKEGPALRIFKPGRAIVYGYQVINSLADKTTQKTQLESQVRLFRDGQQVYQGKVYPLEPIEGVVGDAKHVLTGGRMQLGANMPEGDYVLQVIVTDNLAKDKNKVAATALDFEVRKN